jgi:hypothetical protein
LKHSFDLILNWIQDFSTHGLKTLFYLKKYQFYDNKNKVKTKVMITILIWMTGTVVSVMAISSQKETIDEITRDYNGDIFTIISNDCQKTSCDMDGRYAAPITGSDCKCQCAPSHKIFREDNNQCVKDLMGIDCKRLI